MKIKHTGVAIGLLLVLILMYWSGIVGKTAMKWDATAIYLPWKLFLCRSVFSGNLPLWNPFVNGGFPQCMDPGTWYPISYLFGWGGVYDLQSLLHEYIFHVWLAALGLYLILVRLSVGWRIAAILSVVFLFNGFFVGNAQHLGWVVAATWSIWSMYFFIGLTKQKISFSWYSLVFSSGLGFSMYLLFTGGYPGMFVIQVYVLMIWGVFHWINQRRKGGFTWDTFMSWTKLVMFAILVFVSVSIPAWVSLFRYMPYLTRGHGLSTSDLMFGSFPLSKTLEWLFPKLFLSNSITPEKSADISMIDGYWGVLLAWFLLAFILLNKQRKMVLPWLVGGLLCWFMAMGEDLPFKHALNTVLPGMDYFRFPSQIRFWGIFFWSIAGAIALSKIRNSIPKHLFLLGCIFMVSESVWHGFSHRYITVLAGPGEYVDATGVNGVNSLIGHPHRETNLQQELDSVYIRPLDGPKIEPFGFLWYNKGILLNRFASDGFNPYSFNRYPIGDAWDSDFSIFGKGDSIGTDSYSVSNNCTALDPVFPKKLVEVTGGCWSISYCNLLNNNTIVCGLSRSGGGKKDQGYFVVNQTALPDWHAYRMDKDQEGRDRFAALDLLKLNKMGIDLSIRGKDLRDSMPREDESSFLVRGMENKVSSGMVFGLNPESFVNSDGEEQFWMSGRIYPSNLGDCKLQLEFNPQIYVLGATVSLSFLFWVSVFFIVFWLSFTVYLTIRVWNERF